VKPATPSSATPRPPAGGRTLRTPAEFNSTRQYPMPPPDTPPWGRRPRPRQLVRPGSSTSRPTKRTQQAIENNGPRMCGGTDSWKNPIPPSSPVWETCTPHQTSFSAQPNSAQVAPPALLRAHGLRAPPRRHRLELRPHRRQAHLCLTGHPPSVSRPGAAA
jgi:hypothetical protein